MKRIVIACAKIGISCAILGYLFRQAWRDESFIELTQQPKRWELLAGALVAALASLSITILRWRLLVQALGIRFSIRQAFRFGMLGYLFNFFSFGLVGGDVLKAVLVARQERGRRTDAVASVVMDRLTGLYGLFLVATVAFLCVDWSSTTVRDPQQLGAVHKLCRIVIGGSIVGAAGYMALIVFGRTQSGGWDKLLRIRALACVVNPIRIYQSRPGLVLATVGMSVCVHLLSSVAVYLVACGLPGDDPSFLTHLVIVPMSLVAGAVPLPGGLGAVEYALDFLYRGVASVTIAPRQGFVIALAYRVITMCMAFIGLAYYLASRREVAAVMKSANAEHDLSNVPATQVAPPAPLAAIR